MTETTTEPQAEPQAAHEAGDVLVKVPEKDFPALFASADAMKALMETIKKDVRSEVKDISTDAGRKRVISLAAKCSRTKVLLDNYGKALGEDHYLKWKATTVIRKIVTEEMDALRDETRQPVTDWEKAEQERRDTLQKRVDAIERMGAHIVPDSPSAAIKDALAQLDGIVVDETFDDFQADAEAMKAQQIGRLKPMLDAAERYEAQQKELEELRAMKVEQARKEAEAEAARVKAAEEAVARERERQAAEKAAAEARAEAERAAAERERQREEEAKAAELRAKAAEEQRQREAAEAEERHKRELAEAKAREERAAEAERQRIADEQRKEDEARQRRIADEQHRQRVMAKATAAIATVGQIDEATAAHEIVDAIVAGKIPYVRIDF